MSMGHFLYVLLRHHAVTLRRCDVIIKQRKSAR